MRGRSSSRPELVRGPNKGLLVDVKGLVQVGILRIVCRVGRQDDVGRIRLDGWDQMIRQRHGTSELVPPLPSFVTSKTGKLLLLPAAGPEKRTELSTCRKRDT
jgi:hypothetical protein